MLYQDLQDIQIALKKCLNAKVWDVDGKEYIDFLSGYAVVNMGHSHSTIVSAATAAMRECAVVNLPWHNPSYGLLGKKLNEVSINLYC